MKIGTRKRLSFIFTYGGQMRDLKAVLELIAKGEIKPQVETGKFEEYPRILKDLVDGKIKSRLALTFE